MAYPTNLYQGWDPASAQADFNATGGKNKAGFSGPSGDSGGGNSSSSSGASNFDPVAMAQKLRDFTVQSNQPAIQQLQGFIPQVQSAFAGAGSAIQGGIAPLEQRYKGLIDQITGLGQQNINQSTQAITTGLGARGLMPNSQLGQTELAQGLNPIRTQIQGQLGQATGQESIDENTIRQLLAGLPVQQSAALAPINSAIAMLQSGDPGAASQVAGQYGGQQAYANAILQSAQAQNLYKTLGPNQNLVNATTGGTIATNTPGNIFGNQPGNTFTPAPSPIGQGNNNQSSFGQIDPNIAHALNLTKAFNSGGLTLNQVPGLTY